jgi:hypothetical protein
VRVEDPTGKATGRARRIRAPPSIRLCAAAAYGLCD